MSHKTEPKIEKWKEFLGRLKNPTDSVNIGLVGKYVELQDAYKSISEAFIHAGATNECKVNLKWIHAEEIDRDNVEKKLNNLHGILVAPGFGERGIEGKIRAVKLARENDIPFLGICLGMQCAVIEFARNVLGKKRANSSEMAKTNYPVIDLMADQKDLKNLGGTMRLGDYPCNLKKGTKVHGVYGANQIKERHRHRYEFNNEYLKEYEDAGMIASGINPDTGLVEIVELKDHPWFIGTQYHPEYKSTVIDPHPLFVKFVQATLERKKITTNV